MPTQTRTARDLGPTDSIRCTYVCPRCKGTGKVMLETGMFMDFSGDMEGIQQLVNRVPCRTCAGTGVQPRHSQLTPAWRPFMPRTRLRMKPH